MIDIKSLLTQRIIVLGFTILIMSKSMKDCVIINIKKQLDDYILQILKNCILTVENHNLKKSNVVITQEI